MPISINGTGTITGISAGGLPDACITTDDIAAGAVTTAKLTQPLTLVTAQASTSGTAIDFTGIPSWSKRITVMFGGVSTNGTSPVAVQLGKSVGVETTGYSGFGSMVAASSTAVNIVAATANTIGFNLSSYSGTDDSTDGIATIFNISGNTWVFSSNVTRQAAILSFGNGTKTLAGTLDRVRITTVNGTSTFDAGTINIMYEG